MALKLRSEIVVWVANFVGGVIGLLVLYPVYINVCSEPSRNQQQHCQEYDLLNLTFSKGGELLFSATFWTAAATVAIAFFTWTLKRSTDRLWTAGDAQLRHAEQTSERQLRAYVNVTKVRVELRPSGRTVDYDMTVTLSNAGQTPAWLQGVTIEFKIDERGGAGTGNPHAWEIAPRTEINVTKLKGGFPMEFLSFRIIRLFCLGDLLSLDGDAR